MASAPAAPPRHAAQHFHDLPDGQLLVRSRSAGRGMPLLLLHDAPGAGRALMGLYHALAEFAPVILPDLPGCGESDPLPDAAATLADHADALASVIAGCAREPVHVYGVGIGAALALELHARHPDRVAAVTLTGLLRTGGTPRRALIGRLAPPIHLADDGSHWYRTWLMLRDSLVRWPWYDRSPAALRRQAVDLDPGHLHAWTCDVMRQWASYHRLVDAVLEWDPAVSMARAAHKVRIAIDPRHALHPSDRDWAAGGVTAVTLPEDPAERAFVITGLVS
jgi:pimeloyl-ACP methyl ester carboxylesterase